MPMSSPAWIAWYRNDGVHRLADHVVAAERERDVRHAAGDVHAGAGRFDPRDRFDEVDRVVVVLLDAGGDGEDVRDRR